MVPRVTAVLLGLLLTLFSVGACRKASDVARDHLQKGIRYSEQKRYQEAILEYRIAIQQDAKLGEARLRLAEAYDLVSDLPNSFREYIRAADLLPDNLDVQLKAGILLLAAGRFEDAKTKAQQILATQPNHVRAQILLGNATAGLKDFEGAIADLEEAVKMDPAESRSYTSLGAIQLTQGKLREAEATFQKAIDIDPKSIVARLALASFYLSSARPADAERTLKDARANDPDNLTVNRALALTAVAQGRLRDAGPYLETMARVAKDGPSRLMLADYYTAANRTEEALKLLASLAAEPATFGPAKVRMASIQYNRGARADATRTVDEVLVRNPKDVPALQLKARMLLAESKPDDALTPAKAAVEADSTSALGYFVLGAIQMARHDFDAARLAFLEVLKLNPRAAAAQVQLARLELAAGGFQQANSAASQALKEQPGNPDGRQLLARSLLASGDLTQAEPVIRSLLKEYPRSPTAHELMGVWYVSKKNVEAGRRELTTASQLDPNNFEVLANLVTVDIGQHNLAAARARLEDRLARTPDDPQTLILSARTYAATGDVNRAEQLLKRAVDSDPAKLETYGLLGQLYVAEGKLADARSELTEVVRRQPRSVGAHTLLGVLFELDHMNADAEKAYENALSIDPKAPVAANNLAWLFVDSGRNSDRALELARAASARLPEDPHVNDTLGWILYKHDMKPQAVERLEQSVRASPDNPTALFHLGMAYFASGDWKKAGESLNKALKLRPDLSGAAEARATLATMGT